MRAMILAAGLGTRLRPLSLLRAKPAMPVLGRPVIAILLAWLARHGVSEVIINLHHLPQSIIDAVDRFTPPGMRVEYSKEPCPLGTGGGIARARKFLAGSDPSIVLAGDMLIDVDLGRIVSDHARSGADCTLVLRRDPRAGRFGTIGIAADGAVRRIARRFDLGGETEAGVFVGIRVLSRSAFAHLPDEPDDTPFEDLSDWLAPALRLGSANVRGVLLEPDETVWEPVGTPMEYLAANLDPPTLSYLPEAQFRSEGTKTMGRSADVVVGAGAHVGRGASLERCVIWEGERVPDGCTARGGVFAGGRFYALERGEGAGPEAGAGE